MKFLLTTLLQAFLMFSSAFAQIGETFAFDKQTLPTSVRSITADEAGNIYYFGSFRGALTIEGDTLAFGNGGIDFFIVKKNALGQLIWARNYGTQSNDGFPFRIHYANGFIFSTISITGATQIDGIDVPVLNNSLTNCLIQFDTAGNANWVKRTNAALGAITSYHNGIRAEGNMSLVSGNVLWESDVILPSTGFNSRFFVDITNSGEAKRVINIFQNNNSTTTVSRIAEPILANNHVFMLFGTTGAGIQTGNNKLNVNGTEIPLGNGQYMVLVRTDSVGKNVKYKILNPQGQNINISAFNSGRMAISQKGDSIYVPLMGVPGARYNIDGFDTDLNNIITLAALDSNLVTASVRVLNTNVSNGGLSRIRYSNFLEYAKHYYIAGTFTSNNQSVNIAGIPEQNLLTEIVAGKFETLNNNGPGKSFLIKLSKDLVTKELLWLGDHTAYESRELGFERYFVQNGMIHFVNSLDNVWNPWQIDTTLQLISGKMLSNANGNDGLNAVTYFDDGSKAGIGYAFGSTAYDTGTVTISSIPQKTEIVIFHFNPAGVVSKYSRVSSSLGFVQLLKTVKKNNKVYALFNMSGARNLAGNNYIKIGSSTWIIPDDISSLASAAGYRILLTIDDKGSITYTNLYDLPTGPALGFDVFDNGDFLIISDNVTNSISLNGVSFPSVSGSYLARVAPDKTILRAMKIHTHGFIAYQQPFDVQIADNQSTIYAIYSVGFRNNVSAMDFFVTRNGNQQKVYAVSNPLKEVAATRFYHIIFKTSFDTDNGINITGPVNPLSAGYRSMVHNRSLYFNITNTIYPEALRYNGKIIVEDSGSARGYFLRIDTSGSFLDVKTFRNNKISNSPDFSPVSMRINKNQIYLSGRQIFKLKSGPVEIPYNNDNDALTIKYDTALNVLQYYRYGSVLSDEVSDCDVYKDSIISFALTSQLSPVLDVGPQSAGTMSSGAALLASDFSPAGYIYTAVQSSLPPDLIYSIKDGNWNDPSTWSSGIVPKLTDRVVVRHQVLVTANAGCLAVYAEPMANIRLLNASVLSIGGK